MKYDTIREAAEAWVEGFNAIPQSIIEKLLKVDDYAVNEITPPSQYDRVYIYTGEHNGEEGEIISHRTDEDTDEEIYTVRLDGGEEVDVKEEDFEIDRYEFLPMWGTMWSFGDGIDNWWLEEDGGLQLMADCGFRIYEQEDYEYIFGINGAGYDFYKAHWIPLYKARGLHWHKEESEEVSA